MRVYWIAISLVSSLACSDAETNPQPYTPEASASDGTPASTGSGPGEESSGTGGEATDSSPADGSSTGEAASTSSTTGLGSTSTTSGSEYDGAPGEFVLEHDGRAYRLYVPSGYAPDAAIPVLIGFHGAGDSGANFYAVSKALGLNDAAEPDQYVVIVPDTKSPYSDFANWSGNPQSDIDEMNAEMDEVLLLLDDVATHYHVDSSRVHAFGFSNGGLFTALTGLAQAQEFASLTVLGYGWGANYLTGAPSRPLPVQFGCGQGDTFHGYAQDSEAFLSGQGHATRLVTAAGVGHDYAGILSSMPPTDMFAWMQTHAVD